MTTVTDSAEFLAAARRALAGSSGSDALHALGWWDLLALLDDAEARAGMYALFRAQGRELAGTCALGALAAVPYLEGSGSGGRVVAAFSRTSVARGPVLVVVGDPEVDRIVVDDGVTDPVVVPAEAATFEPVPIPGRMSLHEVTIDRGRAEPVTGIDVSVARARSTSLARVAVAYEILGATEGAVALALDHASARVQFGQPIGAFQAVRHLLAWAVTDCRAVEAVTDAAAALAAGAPARFDEIVKALAGRNGRRACERALQVLGGIGFTAELDHHHFHSRVLALDGLLGSSAELTTALGAWLRTSRPDPGIGQAILFGA